MSEKITNELILEEIRKTRQEVKEAIDAVEVRISRKIEETNDRIKELEKECAALEQKVENLELKEKANNLIIFGLNKSPSQITPELIITEIQKLMNITLQVSDINNLYPLGNKKNCPIKLELISHLKKVSILENVRRLKGTNVFVSNDMTVKQREENRILRKHLNIAKKNEKNNCYIRRNKLHINDKIYSPQQLEQIGNLEENDLQTESNNKPSTATNSSHEQLLDQTPQAIQSELSSNIQAKKKKEVRVTTVRIGNESSKEDKIATRSKGIK